MNDPYTLHTLDNGLRVVIERMPDVRSAAAGFMVQTGARDETPELAGVSHYLEHMMFKGTPKRGWRDITVEFDRMGSTYNAYTSEDRTMYYGWVRESDIGKQIELLADMLCSTLPPEEFEMERKVILEEIAMSKDHLEHVAFDFLQERIFAGHALAWPVLGYDDTVRGLSRDAMHTYFKNRYTPRNMMLVVAGNVDPQAIIGMAEEHCGAWPTGPGLTDRTLPEIHCSGTDVLQVEQFKQQIVMLTFPAVGGIDPLDETASATAAILGGANSRFFWNIVQEGISPRAGAYHLGYTDCGVMLLFGACQPDKAEQLLEALRAEADSICSTPVKDHEVDRVKTKRRTGLAVEAEAPYHRLTQLIDDMEYRGGPRTVDQMLAEVDAVSPQKISGYFEQFPINVGGHLASVGPRKWPEVG